MAQESILPGLFQHHVGEGNTYLVTGLFSNYFPRNCKRHEENSTRKGGAHTLTEHWRAEGTSRGHGTQISTFREDHVAIPRRRGPKFCRSMERQQVTSDPLNSNLICQFLIIGRHLWLILRMVYLRGARYVASQCFLKSSLISYLVRNMTERTICNIPTCVRAMHGFLKSNSSVWCPAF